MKKRYSLLFLSLIFLLASCDKDNGNNPDPLETASVYVVNEGQFGAANGSITSYDPKSDSTALKAFETVNNRPMAGYLQTSTAIDDQLFIVSNKADKIEIIDRSTLQSAGTLNEFEKSPTAVGVVEETAYVGVADFSGPTDSLRLFDLSTMEKKTKAIEVGNTPRDIKYVGGSLFVSNNGSNTISVIDPSDNSVTSTITVGKAPNEMLVDNENRIWVFCNGQKAYSEDQEDIPASIYIIDGQSATVIDSITEGLEIGLVSYQKRMALNIEGAEAYVINDGISVIDMNTYTIKEKIVDAKPFYSVGYFPLENRIYLGKINGFSQSGKAYIYDIEGAAVDSFNVGITPHKFHFTQN